MSEPAPQPTPRGTPPGPRLAAAIRRVLRPLVRLLLSQGLTYPWLLDVVKDLYVEVADSDFRLAGKRHTDSRVSLLTGVHRKDVKRLRERGPLPEDQVPSTVSLGAQLVSRWVTDADYLDESGSPLPLPRLASQGGERSFEALVASVSRDIRARAVLDEWLRLGVAQLDENDVLHLNVDAFVPVQGFEEKVFYFGQNLHDHMAAAGHNVAGGQPPFMERSVYYDTLTGASAAEIATLAEKVGMQALKSVNRKAAQLAERDGSDPRANRRINYGIYFFTEEMPAEKDGRNDA